jgi:tRNA splicing ligase
MTIKDLEEYLEQCRENGATDNTKIKVYDIDHRLEADSINFLYDDDGGFITISP